MRLYAESSAIVAWLLDEASAPTVAGPLASAELIVASELTAVERRFSKNTSVPIGLLCQQVVDAVDR
jgi:hypothetical protein